MTQANNVAIESSQINSSGVLLTTGGGTGLSTVGTNGQVLTSNGTTLSWVTPTTTSPGGSNTQVQFNNSGAFGGSANLTWSGTALSITGSLGVSGAITTTYPSISIQPATTTSQAYVSFVNANGTYYIGNDSSTASGFGTAGNYGSVWWRPASTALAISRSSTVDLYISSTGNVGIGSAAPSGKLTVAEATNDARVYIVATNTSRAALLDLQGTISGYNWLNSTNAGTLDWRIGGGAGANTLTFCTGSAGTEQMRINSGGSLLVGTTTIPGNSSGRVFVGPYNTNNGFGSFNYAVPSGGTTTFQVGNSISYRVTIFSTQSSITGAIGQYVFVGLNKSAGYNPLVLTVNTTGSPGWTFSYSLIASTADTLVTVTDPGTNQGTRVIVEQLG